MSFNVLFVHKYPLNHQLLVARGGALQRIFLLITVLGVSIETMQSCSRSEQNLELD